MIETFNPVSSKARQLNQDIAKTPLASDSTWRRPPLIKLGPCSGKEAHQHISCGPKISLGHIPRAPNQ